MEQERRVFPIELRAKDDGSNTIFGYASVFDQWSEDLGGFKERVRPGAFTKTIEESDVRALFNHDPNYVLGRNKAGTLKLEEDKKGLAIEVDPPDTQWARDLTTSIKRGDITQMSFGFQTVKDEWDNEDKSAVTRDLVEVRLYDVSPVTYPAYPQTTVAVRDLVSQLTAEPAPEDHSDEAPEPGPVSHSLRKHRQALMESENDIRREELE